MITKRSFAILCFLGTAALYGQNNEVVQLEEAGFQSAYSFFDQQMYGQSSAAFRAWENLAIPLPFGQYEKLRRESLLTAQIAELRLEDPSAEALLTYYIKEFYPDPVTTPAILELGSHFYYARNYDQAIYYYDLIKIEALSELDRSEAAFKKGYCYFVTKGFVKARQSLGLAKDLRNLFFYPANYYYGMSEYFLNNYSAAVEYFKKVANSDYYGDYIPYYLSQIYFAQKNYDLLISYAEQKITEPRVKSKKEIRLLLGQAYYIRGDYQRALGHLEFYEENTPQLTVEEFYQLAFTQYKLGKYQKARDNFLELTYLDSKLGQLSNYYLADCYTKLDDKSSARSAFKKVSQMEYDLGMQEESRFNYGKISAELGYEREAINVFVEIEEISPYYKESQDLIYNILVNSGDYANSIQIMESLPRLSPKLQSTYQNLSLKRAIQLYDEKRWAEANLFLEKSLTYKMERLYEAQTYYWQAKMAYASEDYARAEALIESYHRVANGLTDLPEESAQYMANYIKAYLLLKQKKYKEAEIQFKNVIVGINLNSEYLVNETILNRVLPDAFIRTGDCLFKQRAYKAAVDFYNQAITREKGAFVYAQFQKAIIEGLLGEPYKKLVTLEDIIARYPDHPYADDAVFQAGETYLSVSAIDNAAASFSNVLSRYGKTSPYYSTAMLKLGLINYNRGDVNKAMYYYKAVVQHNSSSKEGIEAMKSIEEIYIKDLGNSAMYIKYLDSIPGFELTAFSRDSLTYTIAYNQYYQGQFDKALPSFDNYINLYENGYYILDARYLRGEIYSLRKEYSKALSDYEFLVKSGSGQHFLASLKKAALIAYNHAQDFGKSLQYFKELETKAANEQEEFESQLYALRSAYKISRDADIITYANKVNESRVATKEERAVALYYIGKVHFRNKDFDKAQAAFSKVPPLTNGKIAAESKYLISEIYFLNGDLDLAEKQCNYNNETSLNYPYWVSKSILLLADIYTRKNDLINARAALEAVIENFDDEELRRIAIDKLEDLKIKEAESNRIKIYNPELLELDSTGGNK